MNETLLNPVGHFAYYRGHNRKARFGDKLHEVRDINKAGTHVMFMINNKPEWVALSSVSIVNRNKDYVDIDAVFNDAAGSAEERLDNEIARLESRLVELRAAKAVLASL